MHPLVSHGPGWRAASNPAPLGNSGFAVATLAAALHAGAIGIAPGSPPNVIVGLALFCGGVAQLLAGAWSFVSNAAYGAVVFSLYGCYWLAYAAILIPASGIPDALREAGADTRAHALGIFYLVWVVQTFIFLLGSARGSWGTFAQLLLLLVTNILTCVGTWAQSGPVLRASGYMGMLTAVVAWYNVAADMLTRDTFYFGLPNPAISPAPAAAVAARYEACALEMRAGQGHHGLVLPPAGHLSAKAEERRRSRSNSSLRMFGPTIATIQPSSIDMSPA
ncbi:hypothetical protein LPJ61_000285 [Coemansia biformis]|uniref:Uncharacterized protein n=1 Tax=Coemansia biformis TaxID=1286918 RepID=A0A9W7YBZ9_9FUNG|nr:hypothetical protein LPJ61_000285 [Coemansia biformis]